MGKQRPQTTNPNNLKMRPTEEANLIFILQSENHEDPTTRKKQKKARARIYT
jgi:hypothetical protein